MKRWLRLKFHKDASTSKSSSKVFKDSQTTEYQEQTIQILDGCYRYEISRNHLFYDISNLYKYNTQNENVIREAHNNFLNAGANIIRTNTTEAFFSVLKEKYKYTEEMYKEMIRKAVEIANSVVDEYNRNSNLSRKQATVVGSCGHFEPTTEMTRSEIENEYRHLIRALSDAGIYAFCLQDVESWKEAKMLGKLLRELNKDIITIFMMFKPDCLGFLSDGSSWVETAIRCYNEIPLTAVGINCVSPGDASMMLYDAKDRPKFQKHIPLMVCSSRQNLSFLWQPIDLQTTKPAIEWINFGISYIGGCCGVGAPQIQYIFDELIKIQQPNNKQTTN